MLGSGVVRLVALGVLLGCTPTAPIHDDAGEVLRDAGPDDPVDTGVPRTDAATVTCALGLAECGGAADDCETPVWADEARCGGCDTTCAATERCVAAACETPEVVGVAIADATLCALLESGSVVCAGSDAYGGLGDGDPATAATARADYEAVVMMEDAVAISAGGGRVCAIRGAARQVYCWGDNSGPSFGPSGASASYHAPERLRGTDQGIAEVAVGQRHLCVRTVAGEVQCAGDNTRGQLGRVDGPLGELRPVVGLPAGANAISLAVGGEVGFSCATMDDGNVYCWGENDGGELGQPVSAMNATPTQVPRPSPSVTGVIQVVAGRNFACALEGGNRTVFCWGENDFGQLAPGSLGGAPRPPAAVSGLPGNTQVLAAGYGGTVLALGDNDHEIWGWGRTDSGELGLGNSRLTSVTMPERLYRNSADTHTIHAGAAATCYVANDGSHATLTCAGANAHGELGVTGSDVDELFDYTANPFFE